MIRVDVKQGTPEWLAARCSIPTASEFDKVLTSKGKLSAQSDKYMARLLAEWWLGKPIEDKRSEFMERGNELEPDAISAYEFMNEVRVERVGFCLRDDRSAGASPDGLVGDDGLVEIKCPGIETHLLYVIDQPPEDYFTQIQGQLWVTGRHWCDLYCFNPILPAATKRYTRDEEFIGWMDAAMMQFTARMEAAKAKLEPLRAAYEAAMVDDLPAELTM